MPIYAPGKRINPTIRRRGGTGRKSVYAGLFLTSMVDMFAILVIFLLNAFSSEGELIFLPKGLELPEAQNVGTLEIAPSLVISLENVTFDGEEVAKTPEIFDAKEWSLPKLQEALKKYEEKAKAQAAKQKPGDMDFEEKYKKRVNISADRRLPFHVVKKVIYNAGFAGYPDFRFAVFAGKKATPTNP